MKLEELNQQFADLKKQQISEEPTDAEAATDAPAEKEAEAISEGEIYGYRDRKKDIIILSVVLIIILGTTAAITIPRLLLNSRQETEETELVSEGDIVSGFPDPVEVVVDEVEQQMIGDYAFTVYVNTVPVFQNGNSGGKVYIANSPRNQHPCKVTLTLDEDGSVLYKSGEVLYPDQYIPEINLWKSLSKGVHDATLTYLIYEDDEETQAGVINTKMQIVIEN